MLAIDIIDLELRVRGTTLDEWAAARGLTRANLVRILAGTGSVELVGELAETLGVSSAALRGLGDPSTLGGCRAN